MFRSRLPLIGRHARRGDPPVPGPGIGRPSSRIAPAVALALFAVGLVAAFCAAPARTGTLATAGLHSRL